MKESQTQGILGFERKQIKITTINPYKKINCGLKAKVRTIKPKLSKELI